MIDKVLLFPYYIVLKLRDKHYRFGKKKPKVAEVPTICVGNIAAGGTGKTPHTEMILRMLLESFEWGDKHIAVLSRGYRRESRGFQQVPSDGSAAMFGDEPLQIKKHFPNVTVAVCRDRVEGCMLLCHPELLEKKRYGRKCWHKDFPPADIIVLDDAFQYRKLKASLNVVLVEYSRPLGKDHLLPLGRLRDLPERITDADVIIATKCQPEITVEEKEKWAQTLGTPLDRTRQTLLFTSVHYGNPLPVFSEADPHYIYSKKAILFTGIAKDTPIRRYLSDRYKIVRRFAFKDHHKYNWSDCQKILSETRRHGTAAVITTEKDAQRVLDYSGFPGEVRKKLFMLPIRVDFTTEQERSEFDRILRTV